MWQTFQRSAEVAPPLSDPLQAVRMVLKQVAVSHGIWTLTELVSGPLPHDQAGLTHVT